MPVIDPNVLQTIVSGDKNLNSLSCTHSSNLHHYSSSDEQDLYENKLRPGNMDRRGSQDIPLNTSRMIKEKPKIRTWVKENEKKSTNTNSEKNFEKCDEIKIDSLQTCKDISEKEIKSTNQVNGYDSFDNLKTEKSDTFKKGFQDFKAVSNIKENAVKKDDISEEKAAKNTDVIPKSSKKAGRCYSFEELYSLREHDLSRTPPKGRINWDVMVLLLPEVCLKKSLV